MAGSDSSGGAGIQADIRTLGALGVHCACALTAVTAQDTARVAAVLPIPATLLDLQIDLAIGDFTILATKVGMLASEENVMQVAERAQSASIPNVIVDPVLASSSGKALIDQSGIRAYREYLLPAALVVTPNIPEAEMLTGIAIENAEGMAKAGSALVDMGATVAVIKGGHANGSDSVDVVVYGSRKEFQIAMDALLQSGRAVEPHDTFPLFRIADTSRDSAAPQSNNRPRIAILPQGDRTAFVLAAPRVRSRNTRGTGCTLSSAVAAYIAQGDMLMDAIVKAKHFVTTAITGASGWALGSGTGPIDQLGWNKWS
ncbi:MAG: bifunctional hydroxymethylpyrimidine kinase/phosphomethylpyrimidine kinase [Acidimicrobiales bacterium]